MQSKLFTQFIFLILALGTLPLVGQTPFFTETFSDQTASLANWTSGGTNEGTETWKWSNDTNLGGFINFAAPTAADGFMYFDSDANGLNEHAVTLTSPVIDCSGKNQVFLEMYTQYVYYIYQFSQVELGVSTNGTDFVYRDLLAEVEPGYVFETAQRVVVEVPEAINQATVYLQIKWTGYFEYFMNVDDIALYDTAPILANELAIFDIRHPAAYTTPISQVDSMFFAGRAENLGADPQTNVQLRVTVLDPDQNQVYQDSSAKRPMLAAAALSDTIDIENGFLPSAVGDYFVFESVLADEDDDFTSNNRQIFTFEVSDSVFAVDDGDLQNVAAPAEFNSDFWGGGSLYYVKNGEDYEASTAQFMVWSDGETHIGKDITILLYKVVVDDNPGFDDNDVEVVAFTSYTLGANDGNFDLITAPLYQDDGVTQGIPLEDSTDYILLLSLPQDIAIPYTYRNVIYDVSSVVKNGDDWFLGGFTGPISMVVRMGIREKTVTAAKEPELADSRINSFPNPAKDFYRIDLDLKSVSAVQLQLMNLSGQIVLQRDYSTLQKDRIDLDVSKLAAGAYLVKVRTEEGVKTLKFMKQ